MKIKLKYNLLQDNVKDFAFTSSHQISENIYKSNILSFEPKNKPDFVDNYNSYELIPVKKALILHKTLNYKLYLLKNEKNNSIYIKTNKNYKVLTNILNGISDGAYNIIEKNNVLFLRFNNSYGYTKKYNLGRLYPKLSSINQLSKEFRYLLFNGIYTDIDIVNAHPTMLLEYATLNDIKTPTLEKLVKTRLEFYSDVKNDYLRSSGESFTSKLDIKKLSLVCLNMTKNTFKSKSLNELSNELVFIRENMYFKLYLSNPDFRSAIDCRMPEKKSKRLLYHKIQSLYCFNTETINILKLRKLILSNYTEENTSIIPFFDGLFINNEDPSVQDYNTSRTLSHPKSIIDIINEFNSSSEWIKFSTKPLKEEFSLFSEDDYKIISKSISYIDNLTFEETKSILDSKDIETTMSDIMNEIIDYEMFVPSQTFNLEQIIPMKDFIDSKYNLLLSYVIEDLKKL